MWSIVIPISSVDVLFGYDIRTSVAYTNIETSCEAHYLFVKTPLKTNFSCDTVKSLVYEVQIHASFVHAEIARSDTLELVMFLLYTKLSVVSFVNTIMELRIMRLPIMDGNPSYANPAVNASNDLNLVIVNTEDGLGKLAFFKHDCTYYWLSGIMVLGTYGITLIKLIRVHNFLYLLIDHYLNHHRNLRIAIVTQRMQHGNQT
jgi:hypothetical protein